MSTIVVVGHVNHDRIWRLERPLRSGGRISYSQTVVRLGGGAFFTSELLRSLGHDVVIVTSLVDDALGRSALASLRALDIDTRYVSLLPGETPMVEILVDPEGERTILQHLEARKPLPKPDLSELAADAVYINALSLDNEFLGCLTLVPLVVSQYPLRPVGRRPVDILIGSRADLGPEEHAALWPQAVQIGGPRLKRLVLTDGPRAIHIVDAERNLAVQPAQRLALRDTTGAGDYFAAAYLDAMLAGHPPDAAALQASDITARRLATR